MEIFLKYSIGILIYLYRWPQGIPRKIHNFTMQQNISWSAFIYFQLSSLDFIFSHVWIHSVLSSVVCPLSSVLAKPCNTVLQKIYIWSVWKFSEKALENKVKFQLYLYRGTRGVLQFWNTSVFIYTLLCSTHVNACGIK